MTKPRTKYISKTTSYCDALDIVRREKQVGSYLLLIMRQLGLEDGVYFWDGQRDCRL